MDYASPDTRKKGEEMIAQEVVKLPEPNIRRLTIQHLKEIEAGQRDFRF